jgi:murein peptide amidase A
MRPGRRLLAAVAGLVFIGLAGCSDESSTVSSGSSDASTTGEIVAPTDPPSVATTASTVARTTSSTTSTIAPTSTTTAVTTTTTTTTTTLAAATVPPTTTPLATLPPIAATAQVVEVREVGRSVLDRPITAVRRGDGTGRVVLVIGVIHGDEAAGYEIVRRLDQLEVPLGVDLWTIETMNPDGQLAVDRHNANQVDLNRNFPWDWGPIGAPGDGQYAGPSAASEPETQAMVAFISEIRPDLVIWYHQDLFRINPGTGRDGVIRARYSELTGIPLIEITGGRYTGVAATWARRTLDPGVAFIVELGERLTAEEADLHASAVLTLAAEPN